jgi:purine-nucleoside phosphorylase
MSDLERAADRVRRWLGPGRRPRVAVVLGSGLGRLATRVHDPTRLNYGEIPGFAFPGVPGHAGELVAGRLAGAEVLCQSGRFHLYEGHGPETVVLPVRLFAELGIPTLLLSNAAGGLRPSQGPGTLILIADHLNLTFHAPLSGRVVRGEDRFPDMSGPYDADLRRIARRVALERRIPLTEGVYAAVSGPSYETPAEIRMLRRLGADVVGMSTVPEVLVARARGLRCLALSVVTNLAAGLAPGGGPLSHEEVIREAALASERLGDLVEGVVGAVSDSGKR